MDRDLDAHAGRIAERQHGLLTGTRARRIGFSQHQIDTRIAQGRWIRVARDVYAVRGSAHTWHRDALAACLAGHPGTVTSFVTSGALWGVCRPCVLPYVTVPMAASARSRIARVHRSDLDPLDVTRIGGIPTTRLGRTLVDLAGIWTPKALERAVDTALDGELVRPDQVREAIERAPRGLRRPGARALLDALGVWTDAIRPESPAEARLLRRLDEWGLPEPVRQHRVHDLDGIELARLDVAAHGPRGRQPSPATAGCGSSTRPVGSRSRLGWRPPRDRDAPPPRRLTVVRRTARARPGAQRTCRDRRRHPPVVRRTRPERPGAQRPRRRLRRGRRTGWRRAPAWHHR